MDPIPIRLSISTAYLLPSARGFLQVDTGYPHDYSAYRRALDRLGIAVEDVREVVLTHHHDDHAGFLNALTRDARVRIIAHEQAAPLLRSGENDRTRGGGYVNRLVKRLADVRMRLDPRWTLTFPPFAVRPGDVLVRGDDDTVLRGIGVPGRLLYTPGHCVDHLAVVLDDGRVFCGDAAASFPRFAGVRYCAPFMTDMDEAYRSWRKMLAAGGRRVYPAHGRPFPARKLVENMGRIRTSDLVRFF